MNTLREYVTPLGCERSRRRPAAIISAGTSLPDALISRTASSRESGSPATAFDSNSSTGGQSRLWIRNTAGDGGKETAVRSEEGIRTFSRPCASPLEFRLSGGPYGCGGAHPRYTDWPRDPHCWEGHPAPPSSGSRVIVAPAADAD